MILVSVPAEEVHKVNGFITTVNSQSLCAAQSLVSLILELCNNDSKTSLGYYIALGLILAVCTINLAMMIVVHSKSKQQPHNSAEVVQLISNVKDDFGAEAPFDEWMVFSLVNLN